MFDQLDSRRTRFEGVLGPGTDLVISLFAITLVVIALGAVVYHQSAALDILRAAHERDREPPPLEPEAEEIFVLRAGASTQPRFSKESHVLTPAERSQIDGEIGTIRAAVSGGRHNLLFIVGSASPEVDPEAKPGVGARYNFKLSMRRAFAVADHLAGQGVPFECMTMEARGRSRSAFLRRWLDSAQGRSVGQWDGADRSRSEDDYAVERSVRIFAQFAADSTCPLWTPTERGE